jgi:hypothetical protein
MFAKLFTFIETIQLLNDLVKLIVSEWTQFQIAKYGGNLDEAQSKRNAILDALKVAQEERDEAKMLEYSRLLAML